MIARLADLPEFAELKTHFHEIREADVQALARKTFANPEGHDGLEWERKKAFYQGVDAVFALPVKARAKLAKESQ
jgi:hypothetical protein